MKGKGDCVEKKREKQGMIGAKTEKTEEKRAMNVRKEEEG